MDNVDFGLPSTDRQQHNLSLLGIAGTALRNDFASIDRNRDKFLSPAEITEHAATNPSRMNSALAELAQRKWDWIVNFNDDTVYGRHHVSVPDSKGLTRVDLQAIDAFSNNRIHEFAVMRSRHNALNGALVGALIGGLGMAKFTGWGRATWIAAAAVGTVCSGLSYLWGYGANRVRLDRKMDEVSNMSFPMLEGLR